MASKNLSTNQIILLFDIYRGTSTQGDIGTIVDDTKVLIDRGFIFKRKNSKIATTAHGVDFINLIQKLSSAY